MSSPVRHVVVVLGDQLDAEASAFDGFDAARDVVWMAEVAAESDHVWATQPRIAIFLAAMRHHRDALRVRGWTVRYVGLEDAENRQSLGAELARALGELKPERVVMTEAGEWRVQREIEEAAEAAGVAWEVRTDRHFFGTREEFRGHAEGRRQLRLEFFYREMRRRHGVLLDERGEPEGGQWNFDPANRGSFEREGPPAARVTPVRFAPDAVTREVLAVVRRRFAERPGDLTAFDWPVTPAEATRALADFVDHRLADFGRYQDAMWTDEPWLYHSCLSAAMNLKLLSPRVVVAAVEAAYRAGRVPLASAEGFIRQILGWREYVRGIYWMQMPDYLAKNALGAAEALPRFYWDGACEMACLRAVLGQTLRLGYAHHIQRLMVTGLYALLLGVEPRQVHGWYLAVYVDAVEWVELPNTLGMSQYGDGGLMASKPYVATGNYIKRMSNYCAGCRFDPGRAAGEKACPFTTLYWDFLWRHERRLAANPRMSLQVKNLARWTAEDRVSVQQRAAAIRAGGGVPPARAGEQDELPFA